MSVVVPQAIGISLRNNWGTIVDGHRLAEPIKEPQEPQLQSSTPPQSQKLCTKILAIGKFAKIPGPTKASCKYIKGPQGKIVEVGKPTTQRPQIGNERVKRCKLAKSENNPKGEKHYVNPHQVKVQECYIVT